VRILSDRDVTVLIRREVKMRVLLETQRKYQCYSVEAFANALQAILDGKSDGD
jgi:hypothetical protein